MIKYDIIGSGYDILRSELFSLLVIDAIHRLNIIGEDFNAAIMTCKFEVTFR